MPSLGQPVGLLGGTFDPVHHGHLRIALEVLEVQRLAEMRLLPCRLPPHREMPVATPEQRLIMLRRAVQGQAGFRIDDRELSRRGPSYTVDTLRSLRAELPTSPLCLLIGQDAFAELHRWNRWRQLFELAHVIVLARPGASLELAPPLRAQLERRRLRDGCELRQAVAGGILFQNVTQLEISATRIRQLLACARSPRYLLPESVYAYIHELGLYRDQAGPVAAD